MLVLNEFLRRLDRVSEGTSRLGGQVESILEQVLAERSLWHSDDRSALVATIRALGDLALQGWRFRSADGAVQITPAVGSTSGSDDERRRVRQQELVARDDQLASPAVRAFVTGMERRRLHVDGFVSIFSLMRDGRDLAARLAQVSGVAEDLRAAELKKVIDPYLEFVEEGATCKQTGLRLMDIWRYFRHTWTSAYNSVPGRSMMFLVRDRAAKHHAVMGIGAISSPVVQIRPRDEWIGWHPETLLADLRARPSAKLGRWLRRVVDEALDEIYSADLIADGVLTDGDIDVPSPDAIASLRSVGEERRDAHQRRGNGARRDHDESKDGGSILARTKSDLFVSKRAFALADLLESRVVLDRFLGDRPTKSELADLLADPEGQRAVAKIARKAKGDRVGVAIADISVCGAVPPYNPILGGKLVSMLAASPEVVEAYRRRYGSAVSDIASSMAGRAITRPADLVFLGTTSLYGRSSQYNRVRVPVDRLGGAPGACLRFELLGESEAFGTSQYREETLQAFDDFLNQSGKRRVNYIFGEGTSPKLRNLRDALGALGFSANDVLRHGRHRHVFGVSLVENLRDYLLGIDRKPKYLCPPDGGASTAAISAWWRERWVARRIDRAGVLGDVAQHTLVRPVRHGARVVLPEDTEGMLDLFSDLS